MDRSTTADLLGRCNCTTVGLNAAASGQVRVKVRVGLG